MDKTKFPYHATGEQVTAESKTGVRDRARCWQIPRRHSLVPKSQSWFQLDGEWILIDKRELARPEGATAGTQ